MINGNVLKFGYGDIATSHTITQKICFRQFKPPQKCGVKLNDVIDIDKLEWIGEWIFIDISYDEYLELLNKLDLVYKKEIVEFSFKGYVFDFSNYNKESIKVYKNHLKGCMYFYFLSLAA